MIKQFRILNKRHCPFELIVNIETTVNLNIVLECCEGLMNSEHVNINKHIKTPLCIIRIDIPKAIRDMEQAAEKVLKSIRRNEIGNNTFSKCLSHAIQGVSKKIYTQGVSKKIYTQGVSKKILPFENVDKRKLTCY